VRRQSKRNGTLKILTAAAVVAAMSAGTLTAFADTSEKQRILVHMDNGKVQEVCVSELATNDAYRDAIINAFNVANQIIIEEENGSWTEFSANANVDDGVEGAAENFDAVNSTIFGPYVG